MKKVILLLLAILPYVTSGSGRFVIVTKYPDLGVKRRGSNFVK